jgi:GAF domain-containing protein
MAESTNSKISSSGFELLYEVSRTITGDGYLEQILLQVVEMTAKLTGSKICSLMLLDENKQVLVIKATQSLSQDYRKKPPVKVGQSASGRALLQKKPVTVKDVTQEKIYNYPELAKKEGLKSLISVPMMIKDRAVGVLNCYTETEHHFTEEEIQILSGVANQAALAIENTKLFKALDVRKKVDRAKAILMKKRGLEEEAAHNLLQKKSMENRRPIRDVAEAVILTGGMSFE